MDNEEKGPKGRRKHGTGPGVEAEAGTDQGRWIRGRPFETSAALLLLRPSSLLVLLRPPCSSTSSLQLLFLPPCSSSSFSSGPSPIETPASIASGCRHVNQTRKNIWPAPKTLRAPTLATVLCPLASAELPQIPTNKHDLVEPPPASRAFRQLAPTANDHHLNSSTVRPFLELPRGSLVGMKGWSKMPAHKSQVVHSCNKCGIL